MFKKFVKEVVTKVESLTITFSDGTEAAHAVADWFYGISWEEYNRRYNCPGINRLSALHAYAAAIYVAKHLRDRNGLADVELEEYNLPKV